MKTKTICLFLILVSWWSVSSVQSAEFTVNSTTDLIDGNPGDGICETAPGTNICTLRAAIQEANTLLGKDVVIIPEGTYTLTIAGTEDFYIYNAAIMDLDITDAVAIRGSGRDSTIIQAGTTPGELGSRVFHIRAATEVSLTDVMVRHGTISDYQEGGGIYNLGNLTLTNCHIRNNTATNSSAGAGLANYNGTTLVENCTFSENEALSGGEGAGAYIAGGRLTIRNSQFTNNTANEGAGVAGFAGVVLIENCLFENNSAGYGGAISGSGMRVFNSVLTNNTASRGGGFYASLGSPLIVNTVISNNTADSRGGGLYFDNTSRAVILNSLITGNRAPTGAGIRSEQGAVNLNHSTITNNTTTSPFEGGGIYNGMNGQFYINSSTIYNNSASSGRNIFIPPVTNANVFIRNSIIGLPTASANCQGASVISEGNNLETANSCGFNQPTDQVNTNPLLGTLADNGGPTQTLALGASSPAIDAGDATGCINTRNTHTVTDQQLADTDQRGAARTIDGDDDGNAVCDIGAVEFYPPTANSPPFAKAGDDIIVRPNTPVTLSAAHSYDFDGSIDIYSWEQTAGSTSVALSAVDSINPSFIAPDASGTLGFTLSVTDNDLAVTQDNVDVIVNRPPVAHAGNDISVPPRGTGTLSAELSHDADGTIVSYHWDFIWGISASTISDLSGVTPTFRGANLASNLSNVYRLTVTDNHGFTDTDMVVAHVIVTNDNIPPVAEAGEDITVLPGAIVEFNASGSSDSDGSIVTYHWSNAHGIRIDNETNSVIHLAAPEVEGTYKIDLVVMDNGNLRGADTVVLTVSSVTNQPPTAVIDAPTRVNISDVVTLSSEASTDPDGIIVTYDWQQVSGEPVVLNPVGNNVEFSVPATTSPLGFELTVTDNEGSQGSSTVTITVNQPPIANAGNDRQVTADTLVQLDATQSSDSDGSIQTYEWSQLSGEGITLLNPDSPNASFQAPSSTGSIELRLTVTDNEGATNTDTLMLTVISSVNPPNQLPVAIIDAPSRVNIGDVVTLDSSRSSDNDGMIATVEWLQLSGEPVVLTGVGNNAEFLVPNTGQPLSFELRIVDDAGGQATATVDIAVNQAPVANAGNDITVEPASLVSIDAGDSSDSDGTIRNYQWSQQGGIAVTLQNSNTSSVSFQAPSIEGEVVLRLTVTDNEGSSSTDSIVISIVASDEPVVTPPSQTPTTTPTGGGGDGGGGAMSYEFFILLVMLWWFRQARHRSLRREFPYSS